MPKSILLVDDDHNILSIFKKILEEEGYTVYTGYNAEQAKAIVKEHEVHLVIMDYYLQNTNGLQLTEALKKIDENLQIIFLTGYHPILDTVEDIRFRVERVLFKPIDIKDLLCEVRRLLGMDEGYRQAPIPYENMTQVDTEATPYNS